MLLRILAVRALNFSGMELRAAGAPVSELRSMGRFSAIEMYSLGLSAAELRVGGYPLKQLKELVGLGVQELQHAGFGVSELEMVGFTAKQRASLSILWRPPLRVAWSPHPCLFLLMLF